MKRFSSELLLGGALTAVGVIFLLQNLGVFGAATATVWALLFGSGGIAFLSIVAQNRARWWALIPGAALLSLGLLIGLTVFAPALGAAWGGTLFLGGLGIGFLGIYLLRRDFWWALIPGGALLTLAVIAGLGAPYAGPLVGATLFFGLALTFVLVSLAPPGAPRRWALLPADALLVLAILTMFGTPGVMPFFWPTLLILLGLWLLYRALRHNEGKVYEDKTLSQPH